MMNISSPTLQPLVIDANIAVWAVVPVVAEIQTLDLLQDWHQKQHQIFAPDLLVAEAVSVIRRLVYMKLLSMTEAKQAIDDLFDLEIQTIPLTRPLCQAALTWASKLQHARIYDSVYLAVAEQEQAHLWTADKRLVNGARQRGFSQISWIGDAKVEEIPIEHEETERSE